MHIKGKSNLWKQQAKGASEVAQSCPTLCDTVDCSPPGSSVHGILQARIREWDAIKGTVNFVFQKEAELKIIR